MSVCNLGRKVGFLVIRESEEYIPCQAVHYSSQRVILYTTAQPTWPTQPNATYAALNNRGLLKFDVSAQHAVI